MLARLAALSLVLAPAAALADEDPSKLYDVTFTAPSALKAGSEGRLAVKITPKSGAEIHKEAPISLALTPSGVVPAKTKLGRGELKMEGPNAGYEVPFKADAAGPGRIDATLKFYICTEKMCAAQERKASVSVNVEPR